MNSIHGRLIEPLTSVSGPFWLPLASRRPQGRLRRGWLAIALVDSAIASRALAVFALRGPRNSAREIAEYRKRRGRPRSDRRER
jgi:hypothetical protein